MRLMRLLLFRLRRQLRTLFGPHFRELVVITLIIRELTVFEVQDTTDGTVQQTTVVADDDHRMRVFRQVVFQPQRAFKIKVVGRFVQQQQIRLREQNARQRHAHPPPARIGRTGLLLIMVVKAEPLEDRGGTAFGGPGVDIGKAGGIIRCLCLVHQGGAFDIGGQHRIDQRHVRGRDLLGDAPDLGARGQADVARVQRQLSANDFEQRGFTRTVLPDQTHFVAFGDDRAGFLEQGTAFDGIVDF